MATKKYLSYDGLQEYDDLIKAYADNAATTVKNDILNGAGEAYDTLKELGDLIDDNVDAIDALEIVATSKASAADLTSHIDNKSNPHEVTKEQIGLDKVDNTADAEKSVHYATSAGSADSATSATKATQDANGNEITKTYLPFTGGELTGILYTSASSPLFIGKNGKVGMRAATTEKNNVGQINISNAWYGNGNQWGAQISAYNGETDKYNEFRISHDGMQYNDEDGTAHQVLHDGNISEYAVPATRTINNKALSDNISLNASDVGADPSGSASAVQENLDALQIEVNKKANDFSIELYNGTGGNPKPVRFASFNYSSCNSENGIAAKISLVSGHGNGSSYAFLEDAIIRVNHTGGVEVDNFKYYGQSVGTWDGAARQYGDIFWLIDTTNKIVDFYCLMGQYARVYQTPWKRLTSSSGGTVTQHTSCTVYSSGEKAWANNSDIALMSDIRTLSSEIANKEVSGKAATLINRTTAVNAADTSYTTLMARGTSLNSVETNPAVNGAIAWTYK